MPGPEDARCRCRRSSAGGGARVVSCAGGRVADQREALRLRAGSDRKGHLDRVTFVRRASQVADRRGAVDQVDDVAERRDVLPSARVVKVVAAGGLPRRQA